MTIGGERVDLLPERAAWWPRRSTLLLADLHLGKEETFRRHGIAMPEALLDDALGRLERLLAMLGPARLLVIGDLIHGRTGLTDAVVERFAATRERFPGRVELVVGNHDRHVRSLPARWRIEVRDEDQDDGPFRYRHEPSTFLVEDPGPPASPGPQTSPGHRTGSVPWSGPVEWAGHLHPTLRAGGSAVPAFVVGERQVILPAFTAFSRGPGVAPGPGRRILPIVGGAVLA